MRACLFIASSTTASKALLWAVTDSNRRRLMPADLQSAPVGHLGNRPCGSNDLATKCRIGFAATTAHADLTAPCTCKPTTGVEPVACRLQGGCSAIELRRRDDKNAPLSRGASELYQSELLPTMLEKSNKNLLERQWKAAFPAQNRRKNS